MSTETGFSRFRIGGIALLVVAAATITTLWAAQRSHVRHEADSRRGELEAGPRLRVATVNTEGGDPLIALQGEATPYASTTLFAKVSGFLREIRVDKGSAVRQGQVLAVIESTEVDRDAQALRADAENKQRSAERLRALGKQGIVSARDLEDAEAQASIAKEKLASQAAVQGYRNVVAPFSGVVTQRFADPGALIQNGGNSSTAQPIVSLAQVDRLRVVFYLDQQVAPRVKAGQSLELSPSERPDLVRTVRLARLAGALDPKTRTLLAEADLDNKDGAFLAGGFVQVRLRLPRETGKLEIPSEAVLLKGEKTLAAVVGPEQRVRLQPLFLGEDNGTQVHVLQGLKAGDRVVLNPPVTLKDGDRVQPVEIKN